MRTQGNKAAGAGTVIAIPTFRRPDHLRRLLEAIRALDALDDIALLVADNDAVGRAGAQVATEAAATGYPVPIEVIVVPERGLCHVRNALLARALEAPAMRRLAMIDDDEWPRPNWLSELLSVQRRTGADVVGGPVAPVFEGTAPTWAKQSLVFRPEVRAEGPTGLLYAGNNLLVMRNALAKLDRPWFDPTFDRSGGEDLDFLTRLHDRGARFAWAPEALVSEAVGPERARRRWALRRMWRIGVTDTMVAHKRRPGFAPAARLIARSLALFGLRTLALPAAAFRPRRRLDVLGQWVKALARLYALSGGRDSLYGRR
jgi:GT2 family glycosyltransferase